MALAFIAFFIATRLVVAARMCRIVFFMALAFIAFFIAFGAGAAAFMAFFMAAMKKDESAKNAK